MIHDSIGAAALNERTRHGSDDTLLDHHPGLGGILEGLLRRPLWSDRESQRSLVLLSGLEGMREARCEVLDILDGIMSAWSLATTARRIESRQASTPF